MDLQQDVQGEVSSILSALSSYRRLVALVSLVLAGFLASIKLTLPYLAGPLFFITSSVTLVIYRFKLKET